MSSPGFFSLRGRSSWHTLDDIVHSALADVISADAHFQLSQAEAWAKFGDSIRELGNHPMLQTIDLSVGFGRLENLALQEVTISLDLEMYRPNLFVKTWWGVQKLFGVKKPRDETKVYRIGPPDSGAKNRLELALKLKRDEFGQWQVNDDPIPEQPSSPLQ